MAQDGSGIASIFKRGGHKQEQHGAPGEEDDAAAADNSRLLEQHLNQLSVAWAAPKTKKGLAAAVWRPSLGAFEVVDRGRQAFTGQGFNYNKRLHLNVEEAVYLMDRAVTVLVIDQQQQQQQQQRQRQQQGAVVPAAAPSAASAVAAGQQQQQLLSMQEALHMMGVLRIDADRLAVLSYLSRLGFTVRRHPAVWQVPSDVPPCSTWQVNPAWQHTDGLKLLTAPQASLTAAAAAAAVKQPAAGVAAAADGGVKAGQSAAGQQQQQGLTGATEQQQQQQPLKRRKVEAQSEQQQQQQQQNGSDPDQQQQQQQHQARQWYPGLPEWLLPQQQQPSQQQQQQQQPAVDPVVLPLLGVQLQQQFPLLRPLQRYRDTPTATSSSAGAPAAAGVQDGGGSAGRQQQQRGSHVSDVVYDVLVNSQRFSYKNPTPPQFSIAMMHNGCSNLPCLDEILDKSLVAVADSGFRSQQSSAQLQPMAASGVSGAGADSGVNGAGGGSSSQHPVDSLPPSNSGNDSPSKQQQSSGCYRSVKYALPEEGDVNFSELTPLRLMNLLTNK